MCENIKNAFLSHSLIVMINLADSNCNIENQSNMYVTKLSPIGDIMDYKIMAYLEMLRVNMNWSKYNNESHYILETRIETKVQMYLANLNLCIEGLPKS